MTRYLLDTNVVSNLTKPAPPPGLLAWMGERTDAELYISTITLAEIARGVLEAPEGKRRRDLQAWFDGPSGPQALFAGRVLTFDEPSALVWARLMSEGRAARQTRSAIDVMIAAIAVVSGCIVVTANARHFEGVAPFIDPGAD